MFALLVAEAARAVFAFLFLVLVYPVSKSSSSPIPTKPSPPRKVDRAYVGACVLVCLSVVAVVDTNAPQLVLSDVASALREGIGRHCARADNAYHWHKWSPSDKEAARNDFGFYCAAADALVADVQRQTRTVATPINPVHKLLTLLALPTRLFDASIKMVVTGSVRRATDADEPTWHPREFVWVLALGWTLGVAMAFVHKHAQVLVKFWRSSSSSWNLRMFVVQEETVQPPKVVETVPTMSPKTSPMVEKKSAQKQILWWKWE